MDTITHKLRRFFGISLFTLITGCGGDGSQEGEDTLVTIHAPEFAHVGERFSVELEFAQEVDPVRIFVNDEYLFNASTAALVTLRSPSDLTEQGCCEIRVTFDDPRTNTRHQAKIIVPTYGPTLYPGAPMTVRANRGTTLTVGIDTGYLTHLNDSVAAITWAQKSGPELDLRQLADGNRKLHLNLPAFDQIERFAFEITLQSSGGLTFTVEKILFAVPEDEWLAATLIDQSANRTMVLRADGSIAHLVRQTSMTELIEYTAAPGTTTKKLSVSSDEGDYLLDDSNNVYYRSRFEPDWQLLNPDRAITDIQAIQLDIRQGLNVISANGEAFTTRSIPLDLTNHTALAANVSKLTPSLSRTHLMTANGDLWFNSSLNTENYISNIYDLDLSAYLTTDRRVYSLSTYQVFPGFEAFDDIERIASSNLATSTQYVFAWRENGELVSNARLPLLAEVSQIKTGDDLHLALLADGTVHLWQSQYNRANNASLEVLKGLRPSPFNLRARED